MGLEALSDADLMALKSGDLSKVSDAGLMALKQQSAQKRDMAAEVENDPITRGAIEAQKPQGFAENLGAVMFGNPEQTPVPGVLRDIQRQVRLTGRYGLEAFPSGGAIADTLGLPTPQNATERVVGDAARTMAQGAGIAGLASKIAPMLSGVPSKIASQFAINTPTTMAANAAGGAGSGVARESGAGPMGQMAASLGASLAVPLAANAGSMVSNYLRNNVGSSQSFAARLANQLAGDKRGEILDLLKNQQTGPLGERLTAAEAAAPAGRAEFSGLERVVKTNQPTGYNNLAQEQAQARAAAIRGFGGTADDLAEATANRENVAGNMYKQAFQADKQRLENAARETAAGNVMKGATGYSAPPSVPSNIASLRGNPVIDAAAKEAKILAASQGIKIDDPMGSLQGLHYMKLAIDNQFKNRTASTALQNYSDAALQNTKQRLLGAIEGTDSSIGVSPLYGLARGKYAEMSRPINQMQIGQYLEGKLTAPMAEQGAEVPQRAAAYAQALRDAPQTIKRSTGFPRYEELSQVLTPEQTAITQKVGQSLGRSAENERLGGLGAQKAKELIAAIEPPLPSAGMLSPVYSVLRAITNRIHGSVTSKVTETLAKAMQDPKEMAKLMQSATPAERAALAPYLPTAPILGGINAMTQGQSQ